MEQFDFDPWMLNTRGGAVSLRDGSIRPGRRQDYFTKVTPIAPRRMPTPFFDKFMVEIIGGSIRPEACACVACATSVGQSIEDRQKLHDAEIEALGNLWLCAFG